MTTDFHATDAAGGTLAIDWTDDGGARIRVGGNQPLDQPGRSIKRSREEMAALRDYLDAELGGGWRPIETAPHILDRDYKLLLWWPHWRTDRPVVGYWTSYHGGWRADEALAADGVSPAHWKPLPAPPRTPARGG